MLRDIKPLAVFPGTELLLRLAVGFLVMTTLASCSSRVGDLGRPVSNSWTEDIANATGRIRAKMQGELVSDFNGTDEEKQMRDKAWSLIRPPHAKDWISSELWNFVPSVRYTQLHLLTETQAARLTPLIDTGFNPKLYYAALRSERYVSHHVRYDRVTTDIEQDRYALSAFVPAAERVVVMDDERLAALSRKADMDPFELKNAYARVDENRRFIGWVWRSIKYRMTAYAIAIKKLEIETPSPKVADANRALKLLESDFMKHNGALNADKASVQQNMPRPSRYTRQQWANDDTPPVK